MNLIIVIFGRYLVQTVWRWWRRGGQQIRGGAYHKGKRKSMMAICNCSLKSGQIQEDFHRFYLAISIDVDCWNNLRCWRSQLWQVDYTEEWWKEWPMRWHGWQHGCQWRTCAYHGHSNKFIVKVAKIPEDVLEKGMSQEDFLAYFTITLPKYEIDLKPFLSYWQKYSGVWTGSCHSLFQRWQTIKEGQIITC